MAGHRRSDRERRAMFARMGNNPSDRRGNINQTSNVGKLKETAINVRPRVVKTQAKIFTILPNKKGKVVVKDLTTGKEQTIKQHIKEIKKPAFSDNNKKSSLLKTTGMVASFGDVLLKTQKEKNLFKIRMLKAGLEKKGLSFPKDFDKLPQAEQERRLNKVIAITRKN